MYLFQICKGRGFFCELCKEQKVIFPFEENVITCPKCDTTYHLFCWVKNNQECTKCNRLLERKLKTDNDNLSSENT